MMRINELALRSPDQVRSGLLERWAIMNASIDRGMSRGGILPGGLNVRRRAKALGVALREKRAQKTSNPTEAIDWVSAYAIAVNEENAAGGRVVTAPTNGAAGVIPAVIRYYREFYEEANEDGIVSFLLTAAAIGGLCKRNASLSGAEVGCQGEVGVACSMAAAGLAAALGGSNAQIENAAEIGIEHHLGMSCDPVAGLVQIPCIERNAMGAVKAINAASLALRGDGSHRVALDTVIKTMYETGRDMMTKYKETSLGGLAVNVVDC
jgi:L-serine dehydratase